MKKNCLGEKMGKEHIVLVKLIKGDIYTHGDLELGDLTFGGLWNGTSSELGDLEDFGIGLQATFALRRNGTW